MKFTIEVIYTNAKGGISRTKYAADGPDTFLSVLKNVLRNVGVNLISLNIHTEITKVKEEQ